MENQFDELQDTNSLKVRGLHRNLRNFARLPAGPQFAHRAFHLDLLGQAGCGQGDRAAHQGSGRLSRLGRTRCDAPLTCFRLADAKMSNKRACLLDVEKLTAILAVRLHCGQPKRPHVATVQQTVDLHWDTLIAASVNPTRIYEDLASGRLRVT